MLSAIRKFRCDFRIAGDAPEPRMGPSRSKPISIRSDRESTTGCSSMWAAGPAAWPPHPFLKLRAHSFDMLPPCLIFLDGDGPANPLVACERRYVFPCRPCLRVGCERRSEISGKIMYHTPGDSNGCYRSPRLMSALAHDLLKDQAPDTRVQLGFRDYRRLTGSFADSPPSFRVAGESSGTSLPL